jgi:hypothetical protein
VVVIQPRLRHHFAVMHCGKKKRQPLRDEKHMHEIFTDENIYTSATHSTRPAFQEICSRRMEKTPMSISEWERQSLYEYIKGHPLERVVPHFRIPV